MGSSLPMQRLRLALILSAISLPIPFTSVRSLTDANSMPLRPPNALKSA